MKIVLEVYHADAYKMVGKVFPLPGGELVFLHEESGNQGHHNLGAPGGVDTVIVPRLQEWGVTQVHHFNRSERILYTIGLREMLVHGKRQRSGGRTRVYTHWRYWHKLDQMPYTPPWCNEVERFGGPMHDTRQLGLFEG